MAKLIIVRGLPGSGKSTYAKKLGCLHLEADMFHVQDGAYKFDFTNLKKAHELCQKICREILESGADVVVSNTFVKNWEVEPYLDMAKYFQATVELVEMKGQYGNIHDVPSDIISKMKENWEEIDLSLLQ
jgi:predicted kinase